MQLATIYKMLTMNTNKKNIIIYFVRMKKSCIFAH